MFNKKQVLMAFHCIELEVIVIFFKGLGCASLLNLFIIFLKGRYNGGYLLMLLTHTYVFSYLISLRHKNSTTSREFFYLPLCASLVALLVYGVSYCTQIQLQSLEYSYNLFILSSVLFYTLWSIGKIVGWLLGF